MESLGPGPNIQASRGRDTGVTLSLSLLAGSFGPGPRLLCFCVNSSHIWVLVDSITMVYSLLTVCNHQISLTATSGAVVRFFRVRPVAPGPKLWTRARTSRGPKPCNSQIRASLPVCRWASRDNFDFYSEFINIFIYRQWSLDSA